MKRTIYIINAIIFMGCCLLVSTTTPNVKNIDVNNKIAYVNSDAIKKEEVIEIAPVETIIEEEPEPIIVEEEPKEEIKEVISKDEVVGKDEPIIDNTSNDEENIYIPPITVGSIFNGSMCGYGSDIGATTASGHNIENSIYYNDSTYGEVRILAGDSDIPFGTIIKVSNSNAGSFIGIVLDTGGNIGFGNLYDFDLLFKTSSDAKKYGVSHNATFEILRVGY